MHKSKAVPASRYALLLVFVLAVGCASTPSLMPTPNIYASGERDPFSAVPQALQHNRAPVIYVTDRMPSDDPKVGPYSHERSGSAAFGVAEVEFGDDLPWTDLVTASLASPRSAKIPVTLAETREIARMRPSNERLVFTEDSATLLPEVIAEDAAKGQQFSELLSEHIRNSGSGDIFVFVHGYNVPFEASIFTIAEVWHFLGRAGVPIAYSWPAGHGGLRGYTADRESGEFTVFHLKQFLRFLSACEGVERVNIIAHSRGTDVALTALRELHIEYRGAGLSTREQLKLHNMVLAAPDLDFQVVTQRFGAEGLPIIADRTTIYISPTDKAIGLATWLFASARRVGKLQRTDLSEHQQELMKGFPAFSIIDAKTQDKGDFFGHSYFYRDPAVSSDLILMLTEDRAPGIANGRPLVEEGAGFWTLQDDYPNFDAEDEAASAN